MQRRKNLVWIMLPAVMLGFVMMFSLFPGPVYAEEGVIPPDIPEQTYEKVSGSESTAIPAGEITSGAEKDCFEPASVSFLEGEGTKESNESIVMTQDEATEDVAVSENPVYEKGNPSVKNTEGSLDENTENAEISEKTDIAEWNDKPIVGDSVKDGISVSVSAPVGSFPKGTSLHIKALSRDESAEKANAITDNDGAVAFEIIFLDADGTEVQPSNGKYVSVSFSVPVGSMMIADEYGKTALNIYHIGDDGAAEIMEATLDTDPDASANINVEAEKFSVYMLLKESEETITLKAPVGLSMMCYRNRE